MSSTRFFSVAIRSAPTQLWPTFSHATPIFCFHTTNNSFNRGAFHVRPISFDLGALHVRPPLFDLGALHVRPTSFDRDDLQVRPLSFHRRALHVFERGNSRTSTQPDETIKKTEEKNEGGVAERTKTEEEKKHREELKKLVALENEMEGLEKLEIEVTEKMMKETIWLTSSYDKPVIEWMWRTSGMGRLELEKEIGERHKKVAENWEGLQKELMKILERTKAVGLLKNERDEVRRKARVKKDQRDEAVKLLASSYQDVLSSPPTP